MAKPHDWIEAGGGALFQSTPFYSVTELLRELLGVARARVAEEQLTQLESALNLAGLKPAEALPLIALLLSLPLPSKYPPSPLSPEQQRTSIPRRCVRLALLLHLVVSEP